MKQLPFLSPAVFSDEAPWHTTVSTQQWLVPRVQELTFTAWDMAGFAADLGYQGPPFRWDPQRRAVMRAELDAAFFHLYGITKDDVDYILDTFPIVRKHDQERFGEYRAKRLILENYDAMAKAIETGEPFVSTLDPPPGKGPRHPVRGASPARVETGRETVRVGPSSRSTGCGHSPELGGGTPGCQVCAFNRGRSC